MNSWPQRIGTITLFVDDLETAKRFYREDFDLPLVFEDDESAAFNFGNTIVDLLQNSAANELIEPARVGDREAGSRFQLTIGVEDVVDQLTPYAPTVAERLQVMGPICLPTTASRRRTG